MSQNRFLASFSASALLAVSLCIAACGGGGGATTGGGGGGGGTPPPPPPDFSLTVPTQISLQQGGAPQEFNILDNGSDNNLSISLTFSGLSSGLSLYGGSSYTFPATAAGASRNWMIAASASAAVQHYTVTVTATNGATTHSYSLAVNVTAQTAFQISLSPSSLTLAPGATGTVQATVTGVSNPIVFVTSYPLDLPFDTPTIQSTGSNTFNLTFYAPVNYSAQTGIPLFVGAYVNSTTDGEAVAPLTVNLTQGFPSITAPTRNNAVRAGAYADGVVYDSARKLVFVAYGLLNQVVVYSSLTQQVVASIPVPLEQFLNQSGGIIDESADGTRVYAAGPGSISIIDPNLLQVVGRETLPFAPPASFGISEIGILQLAALADGNVLILNSDAHAYLWNPTSGSIVLDDPASPVTVSGSDSLVRSADHSTALAYSSFYNPSPAVVFHSGADSWGGSMLSANNQMALSPDGTQIAASCLTTGNPVVDVNFYDDNFNPVGASPQANGSCAVDNPSAFPIYSLDGKTLYTFLATESLDLAWDTQSVAPLGLIAEDDYVMMTQPLAVDESGLIFGTGRGLFIPGLVVTDGSHPGAIGTDPDYDNGTGSEFLAFPYLSFPVAVGNSVVPLSQTSGGTLIGDGFDPSVNYSVYAGPPPDDTGTMQATGVSVASPQKLEFTIPASSTPGPANLTLTNNAGWSEVIPDGISYGPYLLGVDPSAIPPNQAATESMYGYGIAQGSAMVGGSSATTGAGSVESTFDLYYPVEATPMGTTSGTPGWADLVFSNPLGSSTLHHAMQFLKSSETYALSANFGAVVYDSAHQHVFLSNTGTNQVAVFDIASSAFLNPIVVGNGLTSLALTPDNSTLAALNTTDQSVSVIDTTQLKVTAILPALTSAEKSSAYVGVKAMSALGPHQVIVLLSGAAYAHVLDVTSGSLSCAGIAGCDATGVDLQLGFQPGFAASTPDGSNAVISDGEGHLALLNLTQNALTPATALPDGGNSAAADADDNVFSVGTGVYGANLQPMVTLGGEEFYYSGGFVSGATTGTGVLNASGSLEFSPSGGEIYVWDIHHGNVVMRIALQGSDTAPSGLTLDPTGTELFVTTPSGLDVVQLYESPLSIASVRPATGSAGASVTIRGSGFESGSTVRFGSTAASAEFTDAMTLKVTVPSVPSGPVQITVENPDGSSYVLDDAFVED